MNESGEGGSERERGGAQGASDAIRDGLKSGLGMLMAMKEAIEETITEMSDRGDLSPERARQAMRETLDRAQRKAETMMHDTRERLDFVPRSEFAALKEEVADLRERLVALEGHGDEAQIAVDVE